MAAYLRCADQDLERTAKAAAPARDDLVMHFLLRRGHLDWADLSVTGHLRLPGAAAWAMVLTAALFGKTPACQTNLRRDRGSGRTRASVRRGENDQFRRKAAI